MGAEWYQRYLNTPYWKELSEEVKRERGYKCEGEDCGATRVVLHLHHNGYGDGYVDENGQWLLYRERERPALMQVLCDRCHGLRHGKPSRLESWPTPEEGYPPDVELWVTPEEEWREFERELWGMDRDGEEAGDTDEEEEDTDDLAAEGLGGRPNGNYDDEEEENPDEW